MYIRKIARYLEVDESVADDYYIKTREIKLAEIQDNSIGRNADELLRKVEAAQFVATHDGEVCPAKWKKGAETLKPGIDLVGKI